MFDDIINKKESKNSLYYIMREEHPKGARISFVTTVDLKNVSFDRIKKDIIDIIGEWTKC